MNQQLQYKQRGLNAEEGPVMSDVLKEGSTER